MISTALLVAVLALAPSSAGTPDSGSNRLLVRGQGITFSVNGPAGWTSDTGALARTFNVHLLLTPEGEETRHPVVSIRVRVNGKTDEQIEKDLAVDVAGYLKDDPDVVVKPLELAHASYATVGSTVTERGRFSEYVLYLNPGKEYKVILSLALSIRGREATPEEMNAFRDVVQSFAVTPAR
jgi:hypothetical protein